MKATEWAAWIGAGTGTTSFLVNWARYIDDRRSGVTVSCLKQRDKELGEVVLCVKAICRTKRPIAIEEPKWEFRPGPLHLRHKVASDEGPAIYKVDVPDGGRLEDAQFAEYRYRLEDWEEYAIESRGRVIHPTSVVFSEPRSKRWGLPRRRRKYRKSLPPRKD